VIDGAIDRLVEGRFSAGMGIGQQAFPPSRRTTPFYDVERARTEPGLFHRWLRREKPDVIFTLYNVVRRWVESCGLNVPENIGLVQLERRPDNADWAGMDQHNDLTGEAAVDMVIGLLHNHEIGVPLHPRATLVEASWVPGSTARERIHLTVKKR
jgi:LacI family transcriptional regulator